MTDNLNRRGPEDPDKINVHQSWELDTWSKTLGISKEKLISAVNAVGPMVKDVKKHLGL